MHERSSELEDYSELKFSREQSFFDKSLSIRWLIGIGFALSLFLILHFREVRVEILELNSIAPGYIVAQQDFDFFDEEGTIILRQEAIRDVARIYKLSDNEVRQRRIEFENFFIYNPDWRKSLDRSSLDNVYAALDDIERTLLKARFTDIPTLRKMEKVHMPVENYYAYIPYEIGEPGSIPYKVWEEIGYEAFQDVQGRTETGLILSFFRKRSWSFEEDIPSQRALRKKIQSEVPDKYTHVSSGNRIIDQGEKVTARHIAMLQAMKRAMGEKRNLWHPWTWIGSLMLAILLTGICAAYFNLNHPHVMRSNRKLFLLTTVIVLTLCLAKATEFFLVYSNSNLMDTVRYPLVIPFAAILLCSLMNPSMATFACGFLTIVLAIVLAFDRPGFMLLNLAAALVTILSTRSLRQRKEIFVVCAKAWLVCVIVIFAMHFYQNSFSTTSIAADIISSAVFMLLTSVSVVGLLPLLESAFKIMTDVSLIEYMDPNSDLLRRLSIEAPGTYQHSVVVGNLAEAAATAIGANGLFCRVATLYHDIGKMVNPQYFTENQQGNVNIHQLLTPQESAQVIIAHVSEGVAMARKAGLPEQFIDIIKEHHGTTLAYYFYRKQLDLVGGDKSLVDEKEFRYAGPKPRSKESAIIMIADSLEAASRSLEKITEDSLLELGTRLIKEKADDGQFDQCLITFEELAIVKMKLAATLVAYGHARVKYPTREPKPDSPLIYEG
jgi:putative nucleotidyltransferase with HDIG domain